MKKITVKDGVLILGFDEKKEKFSCPFNCMQKSCQHPLCDDMDDMTCPIRPKKMKYDDVVKVSPDCPLRKEDVIITFDN